MYLIHYDIYGHEALHLISSEDGQVTIGSTSVQSLAEIKSMMNRSATCLQLALHTRSDTSQPANQEAGHSNPLRSPFPTQLKYNTKYKAPSNAGFLFLVCRPKL